MKYLNKAILVLLMATAFGYGQSGEFITPKYIFFLIGDGMSMTQVHTAEGYLQQTQVGPDKEGTSGVKQLNMTRMPVIGLQNTFASDRFITDSAAAGTAMACGHKTSCGTIAMDSSRTKAMPTIAEKARDKGMKVGILTSVSIDHATPACFYAHQPDRGMYWQISMELSRSDFDFFGGGGMKGEKVSDGKRSLQPGKPKAAADNDPLEAVRSKGYSIATNRAELQAIEPGTKTFAYSKDFIDGDWSMPYSIDKPEEDLSLAEYTREAIRILDNPSGFFMMVEGGKIDWACHANDARTVIGEVLAFDEVVGVALDFYHKHPAETLIVVTGDHETGGLAMGFAGMNYDTAFEVMARQKISFQNFTDTVLKDYKEQADWDDEDDDMDSEIKELLDNYFGLDYSELSDFERALLEKAYDQTMTRKRSKGQEFSLLYGGYEPLTVTATHLLNRKSGISWSSYSHTAVPVPVYAIGAGSHMFEMMFNNSDTPRKMAEIMQVSLD